MTYKKLISALVFAAFGFCFSEAVRAQDCDNPDFCFDFGIPSFFDNITGSSVNCKLQPGGSSNPSNTLDIGTGLGTATGTFTQSGTAACTRIDDSKNTFGPETCAFNLTMTGVTLSACTAGNSFNTKAFCQDKSLTVTGTVTCPVGKPICAGNDPCIMNLGIAGITRNQSQCEKVFPADPVSGLPAGKVLDLTVRTEGSLCTGAFDFISDIKERSCNSGGFANSAVDCIASGVTRRSTEVAVSAVPFDFDIRQTVNTSPTFCKGSTAIDKGSANIDIFGSNTFNVNSIDQTPPVLQPLQCEGVPLLCDVPRDLNGDGVLDLPCKVATCPDFGLNLGKLQRNPDRSVTVTCRGQLNSGTAILGTADVNVSPK